MHHPSEYIFTSPIGALKSAITTRIESTHGDPMGVAGLWSSWRSAKGELVHGYTMLTINADGLALMNHFRKPTDESMGQFHPFIGMRYPPKTDDICARRTY